MKLVCWIFAAVCVVWVPAALAQFDEPPDSLHADTLALWPDTSLAASDTLAMPQHATLRHGWLYPLGIAAVTCMGFLMLFTVRSR